MPLRIVYVMSIVTGKFDIGLDWASEARCLSVEEQLRMNARNGVIEKEISSRLLVFKRLLALVATRTYR